MSAVSEWAVREYFEQLGYLVSQPRKYAASGKKSAEEEVDFVVMNPNVAEHSIPDHLVWTSADLSRVARAVVAVRGGPTERIYAGTVDQTPEILRFLEPASIRYASRLLGSTSMARILCVPGLPASGELKDKTLATLRDKGVHGILSFKTILSDLVAGVEVNRNYDKSDLLQVIRLLKNYDFLKADNSQMELFKSKARVALRKRVSREPAAPTSVE
jgi:hypothetical protein